MIVYFNSFFLTSKSAMAIYEDSKLICIFIKYRFDIFFQNLKKICIFIKYRSDFFSKPKTNLHFH